MPFLKFKSVDQDKLIALSTSLVTDLVEIVGAPRDYFSLEYVPATFIMDGAVVEPTPLVEVSWFSRPQEVQDEVARCITRHLQGVGYATVDVIFLRLRQERYYENGVHF